MKRALIPALLLALLATAGYLRFTGMDFLLPQRTGPDSVVLAQEVELLESGDPGFQRKHQLGLYPNLLPALAATSLPEQHSLPSAEAELRVHLEAASRTRVWIRGWIAGLSLIGILATYWLARFFMPAGWALLAATFSALSLLTQWYSQQGRPHGAASALLVLAIAACVHMRRHQTWTAHALAGMAMGVAAGSLQYGLAALPCYLLASTASWSNWRKALSGLLLFALACLVFYQHPGSPHLNGIEQAAAQNAGLINIAGHALNLTRMNGSGTPKTLGALLAYEPLVTLASVMAVISWWRRRPAWRRVLQSELGVVLAFVLPYLGLMLLYEVVYSRFLLPLIPMMATAAAWWLSSVVARPWLRTAWIIAILSLRATDCFALAHLRSQPDTLEQAAAWFQANVRPEAQVMLIPSVTLPLFSSAEALRSAPGRAQDPNQPWYQYQHLLLNADQLPEGGFNLRTLDIRPLVGPRAELRDLDAWFAGLDCEYVVLDVRERAGWKGMEAVRARFAAQWRLVASFDPDSNSAWSELPVEYQDHELPERPWWFWRVLQAERVGPVIEVYHRVNG